MLKKFSKAILPFQERFESYFAEHFIIYQPRDVVSGDFYWLDRIGNRTVLAMIDCTGHGVPGAFMSMIGYAILSEAVVSKKFDSPADILEFMHTMIFRALRQDKSKNNDGMDMNVCVLTEEENSTKLRFAGAKLPLYLVQDGQLEVIKGTRRSIGGDTATEKKFEEHEFDLQKGASLYLFTDGMKDQNDKSLKKFGAKRFRQIIIENQDQSLQAQKEQIVSAFEKHKGDQKQRDDISFVGIKL